jgi:7-cyano-7-deazaguanine reductase
MKKFNPINTDPSKTKLIETFENSFPSRNYVIVHRANEFTSVCPKTGQPDFGVVTISYIPGKKCVELKSLKFYLQSFRNEGIFYENVTNRILEDLVGILKPKWMEVKGEFSVRGGVNSTVIAIHGKKKNESN